MLIFCSFYKTVSCYSEKELVCLFKDTSCLPALISRIWMYLNRSLSMVYNMKYSGIFYYLLQRPNAIKMSPKRGRNESELFYFPKAAPVNTVSLSTAHFQSLTLVPSSLFWTVMFCEVTVWEGTGEWTQGCSSSETRDRWVYTDSSGKEVI